jgi:hypothetical protein
MFLVVHVFWGLKIWLLSTWPKTAYPRNMDAQCKFSNLEVTRYEKMMLTDDSFACMYTRLLSFYVNMGTPLSCIQGSLPLHPLSYTQLQKSMRIIYAYQQEPDPWGPREDHVQRVQLLQREICMLFSSHAMQFACFEYEVLIPRSSVLAGSGKYIQKDVSALNKLMALIHGMQHSTSQLVCAVCVERAFLCSACGTRTSRAINLNLAVFAHFIWAQ